MRLINASTCLAFIAAALYFPGSAMPNAAPQGRPYIRPSMPSRRGAIKRTWHSGPATTPPQIEIVPPPAEAPPPAKSTLLKAQPGGEKADIAKPGSATPPGLGFFPASPSAASSAPVPNRAQHDGLNALEPEPQRIRDELDHLRNDAVARRAFYDELRRTVEQVRAGRRDENPPNPNPAGQH